MYVITFGAGIAFETNQSPYSGESLSFSLLTSILRERFWKSTLPTFVLGAIALSSFAAKIKDRLVSY